MLLKMYIIIIIIACDPLINKSIHTHSAVHVGTEPELCAHFISSLGNTDAIKIR